MKNYKLIVKFICKLLIFPKGLEHLLANIIETIKILSNKHQYLCNSSLFFFIRINVLLILCSFQISYHNTDKYLTQKTYLTSYYFFYFLTLKLLEEELKAPIFQKTCLFFLNLFDFTKSFYQIIQNFC